MTDEPQYPESIKEYELIESKLYKNKQTFNVLVSNMNDISKKMKDMLEIRDYIIPSVIGTVLELRAPDYIITTLDNELLENAVDYYELRYIITKQETDLSDLETRIRNEGWKEQKLNAFGVKFNGNPRWKLQEDIDKDVFTKNGW